MLQINVIFPHQLFKEHPLFDLDGSFVLLEEFLFFKQYAFHKQKIAFHRATMKYYERFLQERGKKVDYIASEDAKSDIRFFIQQMAAKGITQINIVDPTDDWLERRMSNTCKKYSIVLHQIASPMFLNTREELQPFFAPSKKKFFQTDFYKKERIKRNILLNKDKTPVGGQWTFDADNRKKYPKGKSVVSFPILPSNNDWEEAKIYTENKFSHCPGNYSDSLHYPTTHDAAEAWLDRFLADRFSDFGIYEDAIVEKELLLHHSLLTPMLNAGLLTPSLILIKTLDCAQAKEIPLNSLEGFIRQIIGWREFIRGVYMAKGREERTQNFWGFTRKIPSSFYTGTTGIPPIDSTIRKILDTGYCHHIERLMVLGNFMLLCEFDPDEVYRWFMELFIDAYDWVMVPNVYGMSQFADGGLMATKPYISGSNYLLKMSDYPKGSWTEVWDALFWRFMNKQRAFFLSNPRLGLLIKSYDKFDAVKKEQITQKAENFLASMR